MRQSKLAILIGFACLITFLAGCPSNIDSTDPTVEFDGEINATEDGFKMDGYLYTSHNNEHVYENVTLYLYSANGSVIESRKLGTLEEDIPVSVTNETIPEFVLIDSPDFWEQENFAVDYFEYRGGKGVQYRQEWAESRSDLPVNQSTTDND